MARRKRNESPERQALREMMTGYLKDNLVKDDGKAINAMMREMMSVILEGALDSELEIFSRTLIQYPAHRSVENGLKQGLSAELSVLLGVLFFVCAVSSQR